ncbi:MAG TPA: DUF4920 domain-containing protein [Cryomorphaceae bacterium]|nr:DUF4920 domain-containing protein [Owenweeksia sp.]MBG00004.1 DUF4920 domain-containing protein [Owenweeksia sp.]HAD97821.1 DUF4920 domain-containing protein [Cryomorphaceae bacterium]HBF18770.1 DUF4920 domain-containing protein [Cryomorphaceae bacterium]HCQ15070.1 DUF4920 domain-containing protein [Cryomorphaceae bacterium]|tara:strand:- start:1450 stop:1959 length:510 start_codon:yes stop_codon:yes gene_type:complete
MKKFAFLFLSATLLSACNNTTNQAEEKTETAAMETGPEYQYYGDSINDANAIPASELMGKLAGQDSMPVKVKGQINESCKMKGCWMSMDLGNGKEMRVTFKDYGFFVPTNLDGETAIIEGYASMDTTSVEDLKHYAQDAGKSEEEIAAITAPEIGVNYVATGVIIEPKS